MSGGERKDTGAYEISGQDQVWTRAPPGGAGIGMESSGTNTEDEEEFNKSDKDGTGLIKIEKRKRGSNLKGSLSKFKKSREELINLVKVHRNREMEARRRLARVLAEKEKDGERDKKVRGQDESKRDEQSKKETIMDKVIEAGPAIDEMEIKETMQTKEKMKPNKTKEEKVRLVLYKGKWIYEEDIVNENLEGKEEDRKFSSKHKGEVILEMNVNNSFKLKNRLLNNIKIPSFLHENKIKIENMKITGFNKKLR